MQGRYHIINRPHSKNRPRWSRDYKIDDISLNTHTNRFTLKPHITDMYIHIFGKKSTSYYALKSSYIQIYKVECR